MTSPATREYLREHFGNQLPGPITRSPISANFPNGTTQSTMGYQAGTSAAQSLDGRQFLRPVGKFLTGLGRDHLGSAIGGAVAGGAYGLGSGLVRGSDHPLRRAAIGAGVGAAGTLLLSKLMQYRDDQLARPQVKYAFYGMPGGSDPTQFIQTALFRDMTIPPGDKSMLMGMMPNLNVDQAHRLSDMLRGSSAAGAGYLIAKYMLHLGLGGRALAALVSGAAGVMTGGNPRNAFGQRVNTQYDAMGRQRLVF